MSKVLSMFVLLAAAVSVNAEDGQVRHLVVTDAMYNSSMTNAANWAIGSVEGPKLGGKGEALPPGGDYYAIGKGIRTPFGSFAFPGDSLTIGDDERDATINLCTDNATSVYTFKNLVFCNGELLNLVNYPSTIAGSLTILPNNKKRPFRLADCHQSPQIDITASVTGSEDAALWIFARLTVENSSGWKNSNSTFRFGENSLNDYAGKIFLHQLTYDKRSEGPVDESVYAELRSRTATTAASIDVGRRCHVGGAFGGDVFTVKNLTLGSEACIRVAYDNASTKASLLKVSGTLVLPTEGKVRVRIDPTSTVSPSKAVKSAVFKAPEGMTLSLDDFAFERSFPVFEASVEEDTDGLSTLFLTVYPIVTQLVTDDYSNDSAVKDQYTCVSGDHWSITDEVPNKEKVYYSSREMRNTSGTHGNIASFPGRALLKSGQLSLFGDFTVDDFRTYGSGSGCSIAAYSTHSILRGHILHSKELKGGTLTFTSQNNRRTTVYSDIEGDGVISIAGRGDKGGYVEFCGDNSRFLGRLTFTSEQKQEGMGPKLEFSRPEALGGPLPVYMYEYHNVNDCAMLVPQTSMTLDRKNCGLLVSGPFFFVCNEGVEFGFKEHVTWISGPMTKTGAGTLALGGPTPNFGTSTGTTITEGKNCIVIREGKLKVLSSLEKPDGKATVYASEAFQGTQVEMASGTELVVPVPTRQEASVTILGLHNTRWDKALILPEEGVTVRIVDPSDETTPSAALVRPLIVPICTLNATAAAAIRGKLKLAAAPYPNCQISLEEVENADKSVTFRARLRKGLTIILR